MLTFRLEVIGLDEVSSLVLQGCDDVASAAVGNAVDLCNPESLLDISFGAAVEDWQELRLR